MTDRLSTDSYYQRLHDVFQSEALTETLRHYQPLLDESRHHRTDWAAHMTPNLAPYSVLGKLLATLHGGNLLSAELYPQLKQAEQQTATWLKQGFGFPQLRFTHGGSYSNLEALWQAQQRQGNTRHHVYASQASHYSIKKACQLLGLSYQKIVTDEQGQLDPSALAAACQQHAPLAIVATVGTSIQGAIDPIDRCIAIAQQYQSWLHVDACWGGSIYLFNKHQHLLEHIDTLSFDPHKSLFVPKPCSVLLSRQPTEHNAVDYLSSPPANTLVGSYGGELFLPLWLNLRILGGSWFEEKTRIRLAQAQVFKQQLEQYSNWPVIAGPTGIVLFHTQHDLSGLVAQGIFSRVRLQQQRYYRAVFASYNTEASALIHHLQPYF